MLFPAAFICRATFSTWRRLSAPVFALTGTFLNVWIRPCGSMTTTGMVLLPLMTFSTRFRSVFPSAVLSVRIASAQTSMRPRSSFSRSRMRKWDTTNEATAISTAATTNEILTWRILSVHCITTY